ncbi:glycosyltransferase [Lewinella sp. LCG006]|uniref:glycosyltransferase n=1 Tax=Lewinella sp. LCG006 TaxID=3231911 RepID=UPI0034610387
MDVVPSIFYLVASTVVLYGTLVLSLLYAFFLAWLAKRWKDGARAYRAPVAAAELPLISVIIPARNEAANIGACLQSVLSQDYPFGKMEIIVIDDHSSDGTAKIVEQIIDQRVHLIPLQGDHGQGKKAALEKAIQKAQGTLIVTTDADVVVPKGWLEEIAAAWHGGAKMILGPVKMSGPASLLTAWQGLDVCGTMLLTGAAVYQGRPLLANGANLAFTKTYFQELGAYLGNEKLASGDDIFLLQKAVKKDVKSIQFLFTTSATVCTEAEDSWSKLFWQRLRWAGKTGAYRDPYLIIFQGLVYLLSWGLLLLLPLLFFQPFVVALAWLVKLIVEGFYLRFACREMGEGKWLTWLLPVQLIHPFYIVLIGTLALLPLSFYWKGRRVR